MQNRIDLKQELDEYKEEMDKKWMKIEASNEMRKSQESPLKLGKKGTTISNKKDKSPKKEPESVRESTGKYLKFITVIKI